MSTAVARAGLRALGAAACGCAVVCLVFACGGNGEFPGDGGPPNTGSVGSGGNTLDASVDGGHEGGSGQHMVDGGPTDSGNGGTGPGTGGEGSAPGPDTGTNPPVDASMDGGSGVSVTFDEPPGFFVSLDWAISGPSGHYSGTVEFGDAHSVEFVVGGIAAGPDYVMTLSGTDRYGDPCSGSSAPFDVVAGQVAGAGLVLRCVGSGGADATGPANIGTGSVGLDAAIVLVDP